MSQVAFLVPATTNKRDWKEVEETDLHSILCRSLEIARPLHTRITVLIGYDHDDAIYSVVENRLKFNAVFSKFTIEWYEFDSSYKGKPTWIWNSLGDIAVNKGFEWLKVLGSDIAMPKDKCWLSKMINDLKKSKRTGIAAGDSGNPELPMTQFLINKTHIQIFGFIFPPQIENWGCDNWIQEIYPEKYIHYSPQYKLLNLGGSPRYEIKFSRKFIDALVRRHKPAVNRWINKLPDQ
jgi:hypothetical protein